MTRGIEDVDRSLTNVKLDHARLEEQYKSHAENAEEKIQSMISEMEIRLLNRVLGWMVAVMMTAAAGIVSWIWGKLP